MKKNTHPKYQEVLFVDSSTGTKFLIGSTLQSKETETFEGKEYPVSRVPISSASHPYFTKASSLVDTEGRVDKFKKKFARKIVEVQQSQDKQDEANKEKAKQTKAKKK